MSNPEKPWSEDEKYTLLGEIMKRSGIPSIHLVNIINSFQISPDWEHIPLPPGRTLNSCQRAFFSMCQQPVQPVTSPASSSAPRHESLVLPATRSESGSSRKRTLLPSNRPTFAPRAIQPWPSPSATSYSSESRASALSPGLESSSAGHPRKRGRPSKSETERRKAAAQTQGNLYPSPHVLGSEKLKDSPSPTSSTAVGSMGTSYQSLATVPREMPISAIRNHVPDERGTTQMGTRCGNERGPNSKQLRLPRPPELGQTLSSSNMLYMGQRQRELAPRTRTRTGEAVLLEPAASTSGKIPLLADGKRALVHPVSVSPSDRPPIFNNNSEISPSRRPPQK